MRSIGLLGVAFGSGLLAGVALDLLTVVVARYGPQGGSWSFRGNGALIVPFGLGPAILAGAWTGLVRRGRADAGWLAWGIGAGLVGTAFVGASVAALVLFDSADQLVSGMLSVAPMAWMAVAPLLAGVLPVATWSSASAAGTPALHAIACMLFAVALVIGFYGAAVVLPPG